MIDDNEDGKFNCVVTKDLSRLDRNYILTRQYTEVIDPESLREELRKIGEDLLKKYGDT